jgi:hypothetical protein
LGKYATVFTNDTIERLLIPVKPNADIIYSWQMHILTILSHNQTFVHIVSYGPVARQRPWNIRDSIRCLAAASAPMHGLESGVFCVVRALYVL